MATLCMLLPPAQMAWRDKICSSVRAVVISCDKYYWGAIIMLPLFSVEL